jgi:large subunit ribosomal protein L18Ae
LCRKINATLHKFKRSAGEIIKVQRVTEKKTNAVKNFGIYFRFRTRTGQANSFKEFRATSLQQALSQLCKLY